YGRAGGRGRVRGRRGRRVRCRAGDADRERTLVSAVARRVVVHAERERRCLPRRLTQPVGVAPAVATLGVGCDRLPVDVVVVDVEVEVVLVWVDGGEAGSRPGGVRRKGG